MASDVWPTIHTERKHSGPILDLLMAMTGRKPALESLSGDGVATLRSRG